MAILQSENEANTKLSAFFFAARESSVGIQRMKIDFTRTEKEIFLEN